MTTSEILAKFQLQVDDSSELSSSEELDLANDVYGDICDDRDWEWLKSTKTGTLSISLPYVSLPTNFKKIIPNEYNKSYVLVGTSYRPYEVIPFSSRREHRDQDGYCYIDIPNSRLVFTKQPTSTDSYEFDYIIIAPDLDTISSNPLFRAGFHPIIAYGMAARFNNLEQTDKTNSYQKENQKLFNDTLTSMAIEDANIKLSI